MTLGSSVSTILLSVAANLITPAFEKAKGKITDPFKERIVESKLNALSASAFVKMESYLRNEIRGSDAENKIERVVKTAEKVAVEITSSPKKVLHANWDASRMVANFLSENGYPIEIQEDKTTIPFLHLLNLTTSILLEVPQIMEDWEKDAWSITNDKLDQLAVTLSQQTERVLKISEDVSTITEGKLPLDKAMTSLKSALRQATARTQVEMTGLSPAQASTLQLKSIFVAPEINLVNEDDKIIEKLRTDIDIISELTSSNKIFRIVGPAGAGKTTMLRWIEQWHWTSSLRIAVRCELRTVSKETDLPSLLDLFIQCIPLGLRGTLTNDDFARWLNSGSCLIIFDGFDEVSTTRRDDVLEWIKGCIAGSQTGNSFVIASRELTTGHLLDKHWVLDEWQLSPSMKICGFDKERVEKYISNWQEHMLSPSEKEDLDEEDQPEKLAETFTEADTIKELTSNPLLLSTLMLVHRFQGKKLPKGRSDLYKVYIDGMLGPWYSKKANSRDGIYLEPDQMRRLLKILAIEMQENDITSIAETKASRIISKHKGTIKYTGPKILEHMLERTGLLIGPGEYQFAHKSIGEFLVAEAIISENFRNRSGDQIDRLHLLNHSEIDSWRVVLFLWGGLVQSLNDLKSFCRSLIQMKIPQIALGLLDERIEDFLLDQPASLEELLFQTCVLPNSQISSLQRGGNLGYYVSSHYLPREYFGQFEIPTYGHLKISGIEHFGQHIFSRVVDAGLLSPEKFLDKNPDNPYYYELWSEWVRKGVDLDTLIQQRPRALTHKQAMLTVCKVINNAQIESCPSELENLLIVPDILDEILNDSLAGFPASGMSRSESLPPHIESFLRKKPINEWPDEWIVTRTRRHEDNPGSQRIDWSNEKKLKNILSKCGSEYGSIISSYWRRAKKLSDSSISEEESFLDCLWSDGIENLIRQTVAAQSER